MAGGDPFLRLRAGFFEHLPHFPGSALAVYLVLLYRSHLRQAGDPPLSGTVTMSLKELRELAGVTDKTLKNALEWLQAPHTKGNPPKPLPPYVTMVKEGRGHRFTIERFKNPFERAAKRVNDRSVETANGDERPRTRRKPTQEKVTYWMFPDDWNPYDP